MPKHVGVIIDKNIAQQVDNQYYKCLISSLSSCPHTYTAFPRLITPTAINYELFCLGYTEMSYIKLYSRLWKL